MGENQLDVPLKEKLKSIPGVFGIHMNETPKFVSLLKEENFELREYRPMLLAKTTIPTVNYNHERAKEEAFKKLAAYIFEPRDGKTIAMTSPVFFEFDSQTLTMAFVLPQELTGQTVPSPEDKSIHIEVIPEQTWAVVTYSGKNEFTEIQSKVAELKTWLLERERKESLDHWRIAQYDSPNTIPFLRNNEVQIRLWSDRL